MLPSIIHFNQTSFIKSRHIQTNTRICLSLIQYAKNNNIDLVAIAADAEKAFDRVERKFLFKTLSKFNFPQEIIKMIQAMYEEPEARVYTNGIIHSILK